MVVVYLIHVAIVAFNIIQGIVFVKANTDFCGSVYETQVDHGLVGHVMDSTVIVDEFECQLKCIGNTRCKSFNVYTDGSNAQRRICELNNKTRQMKPADFKWKKGSTYYGSVQVSCIDVSRSRDELQKSGKCHPGYRGKQCATLCPTGWTHFDNSCYLVSSLSKSWRQAQAFCQGLSGDLPKINNAKELGFLFNFVKKQAPTINRAFWIALNWNSTVNDFYWTDHTPLAYINWASGEPNGNGGEPCGEMYTSTSEWNDIGCDQPLNGNGIVCKKLL